MLTAVSQKRRDLSENSNQSTNGTIILSSSRSQTPTNFSIDSNSTDNIRSINSIENLKVNELGKNKSKKSENLLKNTLSTKHEKKSNSITNK